MIGTGAIVTKKFEESNTVIAGVPAKVIKHNTNWITQRI
jgi:serine acetyltransferase